MFDIGTATFAANKAKRELIESGAVGYTEIKTVEIMPPTTVVAENMSDDGRFAQYCFDFTALSWDANTEAYGYINNTKYWISGADDEIYGYWDYRDGPSIPVSGWQGVLDWSDYSGSDPAPESLTISIVGVAKVLHPVDPKYLYKTIDLDGYNVRLDAGYEVVNAKISDLILNLIAQVGGSIQVFGSDAHRFWNDVDTHTPLVISQGTGIDGLKVDIHGCVIGHFDEYHASAYGARIAQVAFTITLYNPNLGEVITVGVALVHNSIDAERGIIIMVKVQ